MILLKRCWGQSSVTWEQKRSPWERLCWNTQISPQDDKYELDSRVVGLTEPLGSGLCSLIQNRAWRTLHGTLACQLTATATKRKINGTDVDKHKRINTFSTIENASIVNIGTWAGRIGGSPYEKRFSARLSTHHESSSGAAFAKHRIQSACTRLLQSKWQ